MSTPQCGWSVGRSVAPEGERHLLSQLIITPTCGDQRREGERKRERERERERGGRRELPNCMMEPGNIPD